MKKENLLCVVCGERTMSFDEGVATCGTCDHVIEEAVICTFCGNPSAKDYADALGCCFCGCSDYYHGDTVTYCECDKCSGEYDVAEDVNGTGLCEDCREAYSAFEDDDLLDEVCEEFNVYPYEVEFDREYMEMTISGMTYNVYDDDTIVEKIGEYIEDTLWAFSDWFLASATGVDQELFEILQRSGECERLNQGIKDIIEATCGMDEFVESAISSDGLGHWTEDRFTVVGDYYLEA